MPLADSLFGLSRVAKPSTPKTRLVRSMASHKYCKKYWGNSSNHLRGISASASKWFTEKTIVNTKCGNATDKQPYTGISWSGVFVEFTLNRCKVIERGKKVPLDGGTASIRLFLRFLRFLFHPCAQAPSRSGCARQAAFPCGHFCGVR